MSFPELLMPAGNLEKLKVAVQYGADAVYLGGQKFGLRSAADNFSYDELKEAVEFAHAHNSLVYVVLNSYLHDSELEELPEFVHYLKEIEVDAVIVSDVGVLETVKKHGPIPIHLSTQASTLNRYSAQFYKNLGVKRIVLGREVSIEEAARIKMYADVEVELFVHGSMCMAYSGHCTISNYTQGRDSNRGGCAHSCRFEYSLDFPEETKSSFFMSSKDLAGIENLKAFVDLGIDSLKVEGRMKSHLYAGTLAKAYAQALQYLKNSEEEYFENLPRLRAEIEKITHRDYFDGSLNTPANDDSVFFEREHLEGSYGAVGEVIEVIADKYMVVDVKAAFNRGDYLEVLPFVSDVKEIETIKILDILENEIERTKPGMLVKLPYIPGVQKANLVRQREQLCN